MREVVWLFSFEHFEHFGGWFEGGGGDNVMMWGRNQFVYVSKLYIARRSTLTYRELGNVEMLNFIRL